MKSDAQLQQDVMAELQWEPAVHAEEIGVEADDGVVTLAGEVSNYAEKWNAERAAQRVEGVKALAVEITVRVTELGKRSDADIARSAQNILSWSSSLPTDAVKVMVEDGWITLTGDVNWHYQQQVASDCLRNLMGVTGVSNQISINPSVSASNVKSDIESALKRTAITDARRISVEVHGADVTLAGEIQNWAERETATSSAWRTPGVRNVVDKMQMVDTL
jgi:osmotically-inducible protein OsmY